MTISGTGAARAQRPSIRAHPTPPFHPAPPFHPSPFHPTRRRLDATPAAGRAWQTAAAVLTRPGGIDTHGKCGFDRAAVASDAPARPGAGRPVPGRRARPARPAGTPTPVGTGLEPTTVGQRRAGQLVHGVAGGTWPAPTGECGPGTADRGRPRGGHRGDHRGPARRSAGPLRRVPRPGGATGVGRQRRHRRWRRAGRPGRAGTGPSCASCRPRCTRPTPAGSPGWSPGSPPRPR